MNTCHITCQYLKMWVLLCQIQTIPVSINLYQCCENKPHSKLEFYLRLRSDCVCKFCLTYNVYNINIFGEKKQTAHSEENGAITKMGKFLNFLMGFLTRFKKVPFWLDNTWSKDSLLWAIFWIRTVHSLHLINQINAPKMHWPLNLDGTSHHALFCKPECSCIVERKVKWLPVASFFNTDFIIYRFAEFRWNN